MDSTGYRQTNGDLVAALVHGLAVALSYVALGLVGLRAEVSIVMYLDFHAKEAQIA